MHIKILRVEKLKEIFTLSFVEQLQ